VNGELRPWLVHRRRQKLQTKSAALQNINKRLIKAFAIRQHRNTQQFLYKFEYLDTTAIGYVGKSLASFIKNGVNATYFSMYPSQSVLQNTIYEDGSTTMLAFYTASNSTGTLLPQAYPFKILSNRLGLGKGRFVVKSIYN
jgi:hypothetical protein